ncbi:hypothetical protein [Blastococcus montanus]|uniref:hypothetical protein n=1 Tax=Blastococcus montanus TaxID=3144973 RepID=UPI003207DF66
MSDETAHRPAGPRVRVDPQLLAGGILITLQTIVRAGVVLPSYYWQDDFHHVELARRLGLSKEFLVRDYSGHLEVGQYFLYWLIGRDAGTSFLPAALSLLVLQLVASCLLLGVLRELFGRSPWLLLPFAGYLFTPLALPVATWWAAGLQALPLQIAMLLALLGLVRAVRRRSWRWAAGSVLAHAIGLLFWEKALLILPTLVAVLVLVEWGRQPVRQRLRLLLRQWRFLAPHAVVAALYTAIYLSVVDSASLLGEDAQSVAATSRDVVFRMLLPGIFGGPWTTTGAENTVFPNTSALLAAFFALLFLAVVGLSVWVRGPLALQGWLLAVGYVAVDIALMQVGRAGFITLLARDPRYITDSLPVLAIAFCAAFAGPVPARRTPRWFRRAAGSTSVTVGSTAVLVASCLLTTLLLADGLQHEHSRNYVHGVVRQLDANPGVSVISTALPATVSISTDLEGLLRAVGREREFDQPGTDVRMFDALANLRSITVIQPTLAASGPVQDCGWRIEGTWQSLGTLPPTSRRPQVLRVGYVTGQPATLHLTVGQDRQAVAVPAGVGHVTFVVTGQEGRVRARVSDVASGGICASDVVAGTPWPAD